MGLLHPKALAVQLLTRTPADGDDRARPDEPLPRQRPDEPLPRRRPRPAAAWSRSTEDTSPAVSAPTRPVPAPEPTPPAAVAATEVPHQRTRWDKVIYLERPARAAADGSAR